VHSPLIGFLTVTYKLPSGPVVCYWQVDLMTGVQILGGETMLLCWSDLYNLLELSFTKKCKIKYKLKNLKKGFILALKAIKT